MVTYKARINAEMLCPKCASCMMEDHFGILICTNPDCELEGVKFKAPMIEIQLLECPENAGL